MPSVIELQLKHTLGVDLDVLTNLYFLYSGGPPDVTDCEAFASATAGYWSAELAPLANEDILLTQVTCTDITSPTSARGIWAGSNAGTRAGAKLGAAVCALSNYTIARRYRGGKPRSYWPWGVSSDVTAPQQWTGAFLTAWATADAAFFGYVLAASSGTTILRNHVNVSFYEGFTTRPDPPIAGVRAKNISTPRSPTAIYDLIESTSYNPLLASQRRRNTHRR
jgi:hypothetical protein